MIDRDLIKRALAEDLQGGQDITSVATVSGSEKVVADFVSRKAGVVAGIDMARAVLEEVGLGGVRFVELVALEEVKERRRGADEAPLGKGQFCPRRLCLSGWRH